VGGEDALELAVHNLGGWESAQKLAKSKANPLLAAGLVFLAVVVGQ
jgi:hypothetical protein